MSCGVVWILKQVQDDAIMWQRSLAGNALAAFGWHMATRADKMAMNRFDRIKAASITKQLWNLFFDHRLIDLIVGLVLVFIINKLNYSAFSKLPCRCHSADK
jgi:hypothetical protein